MLVLLIEVFMVYAVEMASFGMIYIPSSMKVGAGIQIILRLRLSYSNLCNMGASDRKEL
jgi:hypothetical protein